MATRSLGQLTLDLVAKTQGFERGMDKSSRKAKKTADDISRAFKGAMQTMLAFAGAGGIGLFIKGQIDAADAAGELAMQLGITSEELSTLTFATEMSGATQDDLRLALRRLARGIDEGIKGAGTYGKALTELGIEVKDTEGNAKSATDVLYDLARLFEDMPDGAEKTAIAYKLLGDNGQRLIPLLNEGAAGMDELRQRARELGLEISGEAAAAAALFNDNLDLLRKTAVGFGRDIALDAVPKFNNIIVAMQEANRESGLLMAAWVGLGGLAAEFGVDDIDTQIRDLEANLARLKDVASGESPGGATAAQFGLISSGSTQREIDAIEARLDDLYAHRAELDRQQQEREKAALDRQRELAEAQARQQAALREQAATAAEDERRQKALEKITEGLREQQATLGMTAEQLLRYKLESLGATESQIEMALAAQETVRAFEEEEKKAAQSAKLVEQFWTEAARNMQSAMADFFYEMDGDISDMLKNFIDAMRRMLSQALAFQTLSAIPGLGSILQATPTPAGGNALGGAAMPGQLREVNERGPEMLSVGGRDYLMMGSQQGHVTPASRLGGVNVTVNQDNRNAMSPDQIMQFGETLRGQILGDVTRMLNGYAPV